MRHNELRFFTHEELSNLKNASLALDKYELIAKAENSSISLPEDVQQKLFAICIELRNRAPESEDSIPNKKLYTIGDVATIVSTLISVAKNLGDLGIIELLKQCFDAIISLLS